MLKLKLKLNFAVIGPGKIAHAHSDVVKDHGHNIYLAIGNKDSKSLSIFKKKYLPDVIAYDVEELKMYAGSVDAVIITVPWHLIESVVEKVLPLYIPILAEKPVSLSCDKLFLWKKLYCIENLYVAYNRVHYDFISKLKNDLESKDVLAVDVLSADPVYLVKKKFGDNVLDNFCIYYTSHLMHLLITLVGDISVKHIQRSKHVKQIHLESEFGVPISFNMINNAPQNSYIKIFTSNEVFQISPMEELVIYSDMVKVTVGKNNRYQPQIKEQYKTSSDYKQGFENQLEFFINKFVKVKNKDFKYYERVVKACSLCEKTGWSESE